MKARRGLLNPGGWLAVAIAILALAGASGCGQDQTTGATGTTATQAATVTAPPYLRRQIAYFKGLTEPRPEAWQDVVADAVRLKGDGINTVTVEPPVLISQRAGRQQAVILQGQAATAATMIDQLHQAGLAVSVIPSTKSPGLKSGVDASDAVLGQLNADVLKWAGMAEQKQAELFAPLDDYNLVLGTDKGDAWSKQILPQIRQHFHGLIAAKVVPDVGAPPPKGAPHDFERLDYRGYDYLMLDIYPTGAGAGPPAGATTTTTGFNQADFTAYVDDLMNRANAIVKRDGLKGVIVQFGSWREPAASELPDGPLLGAAGQADMAANLLQQVMPQTRGVFYHGWTLPGRGAKGFPVEETLSKYFGGTGPPAATKTATTGTGKTTP